MHILIREMKRERERERERMRDRERERERGQKDRWTDRADEGGERTGDYGR